MTVAKDALPWLKPYLANVPPLANLTRTATLSYAPTVALTVKEGVFSVPFGGRQNPPRVRNDRRFDNVNSVDIFSLTITRPLGFYGVRLEAAGYEEWYKKDGIKTPIERFYWGIASFDADDACIKQVSLKQSRQIILVPEIQGLVNAIANFSYDVDLIESAKSLLPSRLSGFINWQKMSAQVSFFGVTEEWQTSWSN